MNYATLVETIQAYVENDFPDTAGSGGLTSAEQIATFVGQAEERMRLDLYSGPKVLGSLAPPRRVRL